MWRILLFACVVKLVIVSPLLLARGWRPFWHAGRNYQTAVGAGFALDATDMGVVLWLAGYTCSFGWHREDYLVRRDG